MKKAIALEEVKNIAKLARLHLSKKEQESIAGELGEILEYVDRLRTVSTKDVAQYVSAASTIAELRPDQPDRFLKTNHLLPTEYFKDTLLVTKAIFKENSTDD